MFEDSLCSETQRLSNFIHKPNLDIIRFFIDLNAGKIKVLMKLERCDLYVVGQDYERELVEVEIKKWKEVYPQRVADLFYMAIEIKKDFLKTEIPFDDLFCEGSYYETMGQSLSSFAQLFLTEDVADKYLKNVTSPTFIIEVTEGRVKLGSEMIEINTTQYKALKYMIESSVNSQMDFSNEDMTSLYFPNELIVGNGGKHKFDFKSVFRKNSPQEQLINKISPGRYRLGRLFESGSIILNGKTVKSLPWKSV